MTVIKIGTLSMARKTCKGKGNVPQNLPPLSVRYDHIVAALKEYDLDILLCSSDFLDTVRMKKLLQHLKKTGCKTKVVTDIDGRTKKIKSTKSSLRPFTRGQPLYLLEDTASQPSLLARQTLVSSQERNSMKNAEEFANQLISQFPHRNFKIKGKNVASMICGEINYFKRSNGGRVGVFHKNYSQIAQHFADADIVLNPTHDRMGSNFGVLKAKREYLSRRIKGRKRCYVSASNWDINKLKQDRSDYFAQTRKAKSNHSVYVCGVDKTPQMTRVPVQDEEQMLLSIIDVTL
ncbi:MAG: hypothetical protein HWE34_13915 [Methylocystaceae bacterium]|nr:hypothetical protein [Methylocystaceae bacterium]